MGLNSNILKIPSWYETLHKAPKEENIPRNGKDKKVIEELTDKNSNRTLVKVSSFFPIDFFPAEVIVEETKITVIHRQLLSSQVHTVDVKNISNVFINSGILFAELGIVSSSFVQNQMKIRLLWKKDALLVKTIIEGLRVLKEKNIETSSFETKELINKLKEISPTKISL